MFFFFFFNDTATTEIYTLSLHDALPIYHLIGVFWGDKPQDDARHSLNQAVGTLRPYMGEGGLDSDAAQVRLNPGAVRSEEHTSELQSQSNLVCRLLLEKKKIIAPHHIDT